MTGQQAGLSAPEVIGSGQAVLGIEFGSTNIKASLIGPNHEQLATGNHGWENQFVDRRWTYSREAMIAGLQSCFADLLVDTQHQYGVRPTAFAAIGVSAMMHGYLAFDKYDELLVPFRTWRNTSTEQASNQLSEAFGYNIPLRWSVAHYYQALLDHEEHVGAVSSLNTLAGFIHHQLTGRRVLGAGDASGMFPLDSADLGYDKAFIETFDRLAKPLGVAGSLEQLLPEVLAAGTEAGSLTEAGALLLDPTGQLQPGAICCPPEGDAGTGMVATNSVAQRTANVSVGTSIFAMVVLDAPLREVHPEIDIVTTPTGDPVAMVHCNNGASELASWAALFGQFAQGLGHETSTDQVYQTLLAAALDGAADGGGLLAYNYLSGEPVTGLPEGRPLLVRTPDSTFNLANLMRTQVYSVFATLSLGMEILAGEGVKIHKLFAHGGIFRTAQAAQRLLAAALNVPVSVGSTAEHGGAWGIAVLAAYRHRVATNSAASLAEYLDSQVFANAKLQELAPQQQDVAGYAQYLRAYQAGLDIERAAITAI
ncbi:ATPase [Arthrobacter sp. MYb224]|uniref:FGGY-family carbohydrate kinase n=1 Tax=unclassified Arthrobacter TaxID=235627 RepID=UPI000CFDEE4A|nr:MULTISPECIES: FGGY-family carbohydrate kinase [unclassified Arthrobacter]PQZ97590.1 ATPase [Arthrobacter sp. MYb224]PRA04179.1 ATPase [Arthrobacter sp. MYb229]PRB51909.1 ATPase [Arthrobacter sp. MYb216]